MPAFKGNRIFAVLVLIGTATSSPAALFDCSTDPGYCVAEGDTVIFKYAGTSSDMGLFGTLEVIGDSIVSTPTNFRAESTNGAGVVNVSETGTIQIYLKQGYQFDGISVVERGDYQMTNGGTSVSVSGRLDVWDWNDVVNGPNQQTYLNITGDLTQQGTTTPVDWSGAGGFDLTTSAWQGVTGLGLQLQNNLSATSTNNLESAWIQKKVAAGGVDVAVQTSSVVPLPAAVWLFGSGLLGLVGIARCKRR